jgi:hypothetical protein
MCAVWRCGGGVGARRRAGGGCEGLALDSVSGSAGGGVGVSAFL